MPLYTGSTEAALGAIDKLYAGSIEIWAASSLLPVGTQVGNPITVRGTYQRLSARLPSGTFVLDLDGTERVAWNGQSNNRIAFPSGKVIEIFNSSGLAFVRNNSGATGSVLTVYRAP